MASYPTREACVLGIQRTGRPLPTESQDEADGCLAAVLKFRSDSFCSAGKQAIAMERRRFMYAVALSMALILLFGRLDVYVPAAAKDPLRTTLQKTLKKMSCHETTEFIEKNFLSSTAGITNLSQEEATTVKAGTCKQEKEFIFKYISQQLPGDTKGHIGTKSWFSFPPAACLSCVASVCLAHDQCAKCCRKRHTTFCYDCP